MFNNAETPHAQNFSTFSMFSADVIIFQMKLNSNPAQARSAPNPAAFESPTVKHKMMPVGQQTEKIDEKNNREKVAFAPNVLGFPITIFAYFIALDKSQKNYENVKTMGLKPAVY